MAIIVKMPSPRLKRTDAGESEAGATILFFTGVRYERDLESDAEPGSDDLVCLSADRSTDEASAIAFI